MKRGEHLSTETKIKIGRGVAAAYARRRAAAIEGDPEPVIEDSNLAYSTRYNHAIIRLGVLERDAERRRKLDESWVPGSVSIPVRTCGACLPAAGDMLWSGGSFALVWFSGCDRPVVWPSADLEVISREC